MAEHIEREKLMADFELCNKQNPRWTPQRVASLIARATVADVVAMDYHERCLEIEVQKRMAIEPKYGQWIHTKACGVDLWHCSECETLGCPVWKGCPVCLARMDGE